MNFEFKSGDWKGEKHVPVIEAPATVKAGEAFMVNLCVGKEIAHPNTTEHHIRSIVLAYMAEGEKFPYEVAKLYFDVHGESAAGANQGPAYSEPFGSVKIKIAKSGTLTAISYCNIHGFWEGTAQITVE